VSEDLASESSNGTGSASLQVNHDRNGSESSRDEESENGEEKIDARNIVGRRSKKKRKRFEALERKKNSGSESEDAFEILTGPRAVNRKQGSEKEVVRGEVKKVKLMS
jgi:hypothetical protein